MDGAGISLPSGSLLDSYDELGNRYQVPVYCISAPVNLVSSQDGGNPGHNASDSPSPESEPYRTGGGSAGGKVGEEILVKVRLSNLQHDLRFGVFTKESVLHAKHRLAQNQGLEAQDQRWYFGGRLLPDKMRIEDAKLQPGFVIQVVVRSRS